MYLIISLCILLVSTLGSPRRRLIESTTKRVKCANKKCCEFREEPKDRKNDIINCKLLSIDDCVLNDDVCIWDCEQTKSNGKEKKRKVKSTFVGFDEGDAYPNIPEISSETELNEQDGVQIPTNVQEMEEMGSFLEYDNECGVVYKTDLSEEIATAWLLEQDEQGSKFASSGEPEDDINDIDGGGDKRRLQINFPDGRVQTYATSFPYTTAVLIRYYKNGKYYTCSGTMIAYRYVLTAAHCLYDLSTHSFGSNYKVLVGSDSYYDTIDSSRWIPWSTAVVPTVYTQKTSFGPSYNLGVIRLAYSPTGAGYMGFGYNNALSSLNIFNTFGYPGDKTYGTLWRQSCYFSNLLTYYFVSGTCDFYPNQDGSPEYLYWSSTGKRTIYGVASWYYLYGGHSYTTAARIYSSVYYTFCNFIHQTQPGRCY